MRRHDENIKRIRTISAMNDDDYDDDGSYSGLVQEDTDNVAGEKDFDFEDYQQSHHLESLFDFAKYSKTNKLTMRTMPILV